MLYGKKYVKNLIGNSFQPYKALGIRSKNSLLQKYLSLLNKSSEIIKLYELINDLLDMLVLHKKLKLKS